jgi:BASS family bile acid:Na+ symporter
MDAFGILSIFFLAIIGLGMGAITTRDDFNVALSTKAAPLIGFFSQYIFMPLFAFALCKAFRLKEAYAIGVILVGSCPGGATSNIFTYWGKGNVALSIVMSIFSNVAAFGMMPLLIYVLINKGYSSDNFSMPWDAVFISLVLVVVPLFIGLAVREYDHTTIGGYLIWEWLESITSKISIVFFVAALSLGIYAYAPSLYNAPPSLWIIAVLMEPAGAAFGFIAATFAGVSFKDRRTIGIETGVQSFTLAIAIVSFSYSGDFHDDAVLFPVMYGIMYLANSFWIVLVLRYVITPYDGEAEEVKEHGFEVVRTKNLSAADGGPEDSKSEVVLVYDNAV